MDRVDRALNQRMYLLDATRPGDMAWELMIEGSRGVPYRVFLSPQKSSCTCPDYMRRRAACKHIMFISLRVLRLQTISLLLTPAMDEALKKALLGRSEEPKEQLTDEPPSESPPLDGCCPICYEDFEPTDKCDKCSTCKNAIHSACIAVWLRQKNNCPLCRSTWFAKGSAKVSASDDALAKFSLASAGLAESLAAASAASAVSARSSDRMSLTAAKKKYKLKDEDFQGLPFLSVTNPVMPHAHPMRLYMVSDLERVRSAKLERKKDEEEGKAASKRSKVEQKAVEKAAKKAEKEAKKQREAEEKKAAREAEKAKKQALKDAAKIASRKATKETRKEETANSSQTDSAVKKKKPTAKKEEVQVDLTNVRRSGRVRKAPTQVDEVVALVTETKPQRATKRARRA